MGVHVTNAGQVPVCVRGSNNILQVDFKGSKNLATLATKRDGLQDSRSGRYNSHTNSIIWECRARSLCTK
ncbi:hypothetical protein DPMN_121559 [Dreissena polymorpha]|uniref:Uncharacterized protein n=1 Tax=Dreissena polymorpha TaxID=45954 RepID=A0A9D4JPJ1_DREPO|nr:hypothetical protein DPMN_121559 [Dreissena polymorpha]